MASSQNRACPITGKLRRIACRRCSKSCAATAPTAATGTTADQSLLMHGQYPPSGIAIARRDGDFSHATADEHVRRRVPEGHK